MAILNIDYAALWARVGDFARKAGRVSARPVLLLYFVMTGKDTPVKDKVMIFSALSYLVLPVNVLKGKRLPLLGWIDEIVSISVACQKVCEHITPEMEARADALLDRWFTDYTPYVEVME